MMSADKLQQKLKNIRAVAFDKDGTLIDFDRTWFAFSYQMAKEAAQGDEQRAHDLMDAAGYDWNRRRFRAGSAIAAGTVHEIVALLYPHSTLQERQLIVETISEKSAQAGAQAAIAIDGMEQALSALHEGGLILGVVTNDSEFGAKQAVAALGIAPFFACVIGYDTASRPKPFADPLLYFAKETGLHPSQLAMVGDNLHDLEAARAAGVGLAIGVLSGNAPRVVLEPHADVVLESVADLPDLFFLEAK